uniref:Endonuclease n=1 Tax=Pseudomonas phage HRDY3 TaxID=3236930 RepID=A0AB39CER6_9VIRU
MEAQHRSHPRAARIQKLVGVMDEHMVRLTRLHFSYLENFYDTEQEIATAIFLLYDGSEIFGHFKARHKHGTAIIDFEIERNNQVLKKGTGIKEWCQYMKERGVLRPWVDWKGEGV